MRWLTSRGSGLALALILATRASSVAAADPDDGNAAAAEALFQDARRLMEARRYAEACPKFAASYKLAPKGGALLNLADCYERNGQVASAWARFHEAIALAQRGGRPDREKTARDRADALEPRLIKIAISSRSPEAEVKLDGTPLDAAALGTPVPVDPGRHVIEATQKGKKRYVANVEVTEQVKVSRWEIPPLENEPKAATPDRPAPTNAGSVQRILGAGGVFLGLVGIGVGTYFGLRTTKLWDDVKQQCHPPAQGGPLECGEASALELKRDAERAGNLSTVAFLVGGALVAGGAVVFLTAPKTPTRPRVGIGPTAIFASGTFW